MGVLLVWYQSIAPCVSKGNISANAIVILGKLLQLIGLQVRL